MAASTAENFRAFIAIALEPALVTELQKLQRQLQAELEATHPDRYVAIEPESGEHFLADSFGGAVAAARAAHPDRISFVIRIGHPAAIHLGGVTN